ncbi:MAG: DUF4360 domain-containing protein [Bdellovibrionales bacterium]|nr:DUF4360 domain-containing protein [Bdellovibrionales bacterium]
MKKFTYICLLFVWVAAAAQSPPASSVGITSFNYSGSGCRQGSVSALLSLDGEAITLLFDDYVVDSSDSPAPLTMKNCDLAFTLSAPPGWEYALLGIEYRGYADLQEGVSGYHSSQYGFGALAHRIRLGAMELEGPYADDYVRVVELPLNERSWSSCQQPSSVLHLNTQLWVRRESKDPGHDRRRDSTARAGAVESALRPEGLITLDSLDGHVMEDYKIEWRRCAAPDKPEHPNRPEHPEHPAHPNPPKQPQRPAPPSKPGRGH